METEIKLNSGYRIPLIGLGTCNKSRMTSSEFFKSYNEGSLQEAVCVAIQSGYRYFDTAWIYGNEVELGAAINSKINDKTVTREDLFITTKLWNNFHEREDVVRALKESLSLLNLTYVDLFLIHWPMGFKLSAPYLPVFQNSAYSDVDYLETWKGMEDCVRFGLTRSIGVANFSIEQIDRLLRHVQIAPAVNQIEIHPLFNQKKMIQFCKKRGIVMIGYWPLGINDLSGIPQSPDQRFFDKKITAMAEKYNKTVGQIVVNYLVSLGICFIVKSVGLFKILEYNNVLNFKLDTEDVEYLDSLNRNERMVLCSAFMDHKYYPFD